VPNGASSTHALHCDAVIAASKLFATSLKNQGIAQEDTSEGLAPLPTTSQSTTTTLDHLITQNSPEILLSYPRYTYKVTPSRKSRRVTSAPHHNNNNKRTHIYQNIHNSTTESSTPRNRYWRHVTEKERVVINLRVSTCEERVRFASILFLLLRGFKSRGGA
jgi:hypothetical protein